MSPLIALVLFEKACSFKGLYHNFVQAVKRLLVYTINLSLSADLEDPTSAKKKCPSGLTTNTPPPPPQRVTENSQNFVADLILKIRKGGLLYGNICTFTLFSINVIPVDHSRKEELLHKFKHFRGESVVKGNLFNRSNTFNQRFVMKKKRNKTLAKCFFVLFFSPKMSSSSTLSTISTRNRFFFYPIFFRYSSYKVQIYSEWGTHRPLRAFSLSGYVFPWSSWSM